jgi:hypothetical protein
VTDGNDSKTAALRWLPRHPRLLRWDRSFAIGDATFRWHSRLDGTAVIHGPAGHFAIGDLVPMPVGHLHGAVPAEPVRYRITRLHEENGHVWLEAVRADTPHA